MMEFWNSALKIKVLDKNWVEKIDGLQGFWMSRFQASKIKRYSKSVQNYYTRSNWYQICQNGQNIVHFQRNSRVPHDSLKIPGMMKFWNSVLKIKLLDTNWVGFIPYMLISVRTSQFQGTSGILESWIPGSRNHDISSNVRKINTNMLCRLIF